MYMYVRYLCVPTTKNSKTHIMRQLRTVHIGQFSFDLPNTFQFGLYPICHVPTNIRAVLRHGL